MSARPIKQNPFRILLVTPEWPPAHCGIAEFSKRLVCALDKKLTIKKRILKNYLDLAPIIKELETERYGFLHIIINKEHITDRAYLELIQITKKYFPKVFVILSYIPSAKKINKEIRRIISLADGVISHGTLDIVLPSHIPSMELSCGATVDIERFDIRTNSKYPIKSEPFKLMYFGFLNESKGVDVLVRAIKLIPKKYKITFNILGSVHQNYINKKINTNLKYSGKIHKIISLLDDRRVSFSVSYQNIKKLKQELLNSDCCVLPFRDGASNKHSSLFVAVSSGLPIITTRTQAIPKNIRNIPYIVLVPPRQPLKLKQAIMNVYTKDKTSYKKRMIIREYYEKNFGWEVIAEKIEELYSKVKKSTALKIAVPN